jgi:proteasome accessory factor PafA2
VAIPKVCGIETEYGVTLRGAADPNPVLASSMLINGYVEHHKVGWDFEDESPGRDARGFAREGAMPPEIETHLVNTVLTNGARYYVDHAHPEYSTPECSDALELVCADKAGERILARSMLAARRLTEPGQEIVVYKNNSDGKGNSYGTHENYLVDRAVPFAALVRTLLPWFVSRQVFTGAGKVGSENGAAAVDYQISQRADFFEEEVGLETTLKRPIVNTRDEPHADPQLYRRLHVIAGDANLCEVATFLKVGTTAIVLAMIEDGFIAKDLSIIGPVTAMRTVSHDPTCRATVELLDGGRLTAIELQWEFLRLAQKYADETGLDACGGDDVGGRVLARWEGALGDLERDPMLLDGQLDWVTKRSLLGAYIDRDGLEWSDPKLSLLDLQYHDVRPDRSLYERLVRAGKVERLVTEEEVHTAMTVPPSTTRAYFRGGCLARWPDSVVAANWDSLILDVGSDPLRRIPMMEPLRGTKAHVEPLFEQVGTPAELVERLQG